VAFVRFLLELRDAFEAPDSPLPQEIVKAFKVLGVEEAEIEGCPKSSFLGLVTSSNYRHLISDVCKVAQPVQLGEACAAFDPTQPSSQLMLETP
jgi:hypothetical protein